MANVVHLAHNHARVPVVVLSVDSDDALISVKLKEANICVDSMSSCPPMRTWNGSASIPKLAHDSSARKIGEGGMHSKNSA